MLHKKQGMRALNIVQDIRERLDQQDNFQGKRGIDPPKNMGAILQYNFTVLSIPETPFQSAGHKSFFKFILNAFLNPYLPIGL